MDEGALGVHKIELVVQPGPGLRDGCGVGQHAHGSGHLGQVTTRHHSRRLVVDADLRRELWKGVRDMPTLWLYIL